MQSGTTKKIASYLVTGTDFGTSRDGSKIIYNTENGLYLYSGLGKTEKLSNDYCSQVYTPDDALSTIYYVDEDDTLFCNKTGKAGDSFKIADDVSGVSVSGNGVYYTTDSRNVSMYDYIDKSLLAVILSDLENPDTGEIDLSGYTFEELEELREQYRTDTTAYKRISEIIYLKDELAQEQHLMTLHYFDGSQSSVVAEDVIHGSVDLATNRAIDQSHTAAVLAYAACPDPEKAAALTADDLEAIIESSDSSASSEIYNKIRSSAVAVNGTAYALDLNVWTINPSEDGQTVYITTKNPDNSDIDLYQAGISGNSLQTPTQIASDISYWKIIGNNVVSGRTPPSSSMVSGSTTMCIATSRSGTTARSCTWSAKKTTTAISSSPIKTVRSRRSQTMCSTLASRPAEICCICVTITLTAARAPCICTMVRTAQSWMTMLPRLCPEKFLLTVTAGSTTEIPATSIIIRS